MNATPPRTEGDTRVTLPAARAASPVAKDGGDEEAHGEGTTARIPTPVRSRRTGPRFPQVPRQGHARHGRAHGRGRPARAGPGPDARPALRGRQRHGRLPGRLDRAGVRGDAAHRGRHGLRPDPGVQPGAGPARPGCPGRPGAGAGRHDAAPAGAGVRGGRRAADRRRSLPGRGARARSARPVARRGLHPADRHLRLQLRARRVLQRGPARPPAVPGAGGDLRRLQHRHHHGDVRAGRALGGALGGGRGRGRRRLDGRHPTALCSTAVAAAPGRPRRKRSWWRRRPGRRWRSRWSRPCCSSR